MCSEIEIGPSGKNLHKHKIFSEILDQFIYSLRNAKLFFGEYTLVVLSFQISFVSPFIRFFCPLTLCYLVTNNPAGDGQLANKKRQNKWLFQRLMEILFLHCIKYLFKKLNGTVSWMWKTIIWFFNVVNIFDKYKSHF